MLNTASYYLAYLKEEDLELKSFALNKIYNLVDLNWAEISDFIKDFESLFESKIVHNENGLIALILSKIYYNLEDYELAVEWALEADSYLNLSEKSQFVTTILRKIIEKYIQQRKNNFFNEEQTVIDSRIQNIVERIFGRCISLKEINQAIGFSFESYDLERLALSIESSDNIAETLKYVYQITQDLIVNNKYKNAILKVVLSLYVKHANNSFVDITNCQFLLNNSNALSSTLLKILANPEEPLIAYQIAFDLADNQNSAYLKEICRLLKEHSTQPQPQEPVHAENLESVSNQNTSNNETERTPLVAEENQYIQSISSNANLSNPFFNIDKERLKKLIGILEGSIQRQLKNYCLKKLNKTDGNIVKNMVKAVEKSGSVVHLAVVIANSLMNSHSSNDQFLKENMEWLGKSTNWARFTSAATLGVIHMGNLEKGLEIMKPYLPGSAVPSIYAQAGSYYGLGLIYANTNDDYILNFLQDAQTMPSNSREVFQHGIFLGIGLVGMACHNEQLYEKLRDGMYTDDAIVGEAAAIAIGLIMLGSRNEQAVQDLITYSHDTQHEKIIRAISISLALIMYGAEEAADTLIEQLSREKDPILRYGAMFVIGLAYAGTGNTNAFRKLIKFSVSDVNDEVRRAALINVGFLQIKNPEVLLQNLKVLTLLSESYNPHVRYGAAMALGIACAGTAMTQAYSILQPLFSDPNYLVRQGAFLATGLIFSQCTAAQEPKLQHFKETLEKVIQDKDEHILIRFGAIISQGFMNLGGRNSRINLVSNNGNNKMAAIVGMALFTQYYYWFPMIHFINLAVEPVILFGVDSNLKIVKNFQVLSKAKPSIYGYPSEIKLEEKSQEKKVPTAVLSTVGRAKAKNKRLGTATSINAEMNLENQISTSNLIQNLEKKEEENKDDAIAKEKEVKEKEAAAKVEEPNQEFLSNPFRILPKQHPVISFFENQDHKLILNNRFNGFVLLNKINLGAYTEYFEDEVPQNEVKLPEEAKSNTVPAGSYQAVPTNDVEMPEEIDLNLLNKK